MIKGLIENGTAIKLQKSTKLYEKLGLSAKFVNRKDKLCVINSNCSKKCKTRRLRKLSNELAKLRGVRSDQPHSIHYILEIADT